MRYCTFILSIACSIASVTSYFIEKRLKIYKMAISILLKFLILKWNVSRTIWRIEVGDGSLFCIFHALSFELNIFFDRRFPLNIPFLITPLGCMATYVNSFFTFYKRLSVTYNVMRRIMESSLFRLICPKIVFRMLAPRFAHIKTKRSFSD